MKKIIVFFFIIYPFYLIQSQEIKRVTSLEANLLLKDYNSNAMVIIDGRDSAKFYTGHLKGAIYIDAFDSLALKSLNRYLDKEMIFVYCTTNNRSTLIIERLEQLNYHGQIVNMTDGVTGWKQNGYDLELMPVNVLHQQGSDEKQVKPFEPQGKLIIQVFGNFDYNATQDAQKQYGFWFGRAHFGYEYQFSKHFSGKIIIDAGRPTSVGQIEVRDTTGLNLNTSNASKEGSYYTMTLKFASLEWNPNEHIKIQAGGVLQNHYMTQERFWGYRYVAPTFQDKYYGIPSSDLGIIGYFKINDQLGVDVALTNGEGFRFDQDAYGDVKIATGVDYCPIRGLQTRFYYDYTQSNNPLKPANQQLFSVFAGYKLKDKFRVGGEFNYRMNHLNVANHDLFGYSVFGTYGVNKRMELFARFDYLQANTLNNNLHNWYFQNTGKAYISGIHYKATDGVNISLNYQGWQPDDTSINFQHHIVLSFEYKL
ncbi:MAG: hypothetical protein EOL95_05130 [Bacteroidia bacterium]|nr:hypothetical protein [Bacteroidia bacterium]